MSECGSCKHWTGNDSTYMAKCTLHAVTISFNHGCKDHSPRQTVLKPGEKLQETKDYTQYYTTVRPLNPAEIQEIKDAQG